MSDLSNSDKNFKPSSTNVSSVVPNAMENNLVEATEPNSRADDGGNETGEVEVSKRDQAVIETVYSFIGKEVDSAMTQEIDTNGSESDRKDSNPKNPVTKLLGSEVVTVYVGESRQKVLIHKAVLCSKSEYFQKAFNGNFLEARSLELELDDVSISVFLNFAEWACKHKISTEETGIDEYIDLYLFADRIFCAPFKNYIMDCLQDWFLPKPSTRILTYRQIKRILENTISAEESPIRKFCGASVSYYLRIGGDVEHVSRIFRIQGFLKEFCDFQNTVCNAQSIRNCDDSAVGMGSNPNARKISRGMLSKYLSNCHRFVNQVDPGAEEFGFPICFFHAHREGEACTSTPNFVEDEDDEDDEDDESDEGGFHASVTSDETE